VFVRGTDNGLWHRWSDDGGVTWGNWEPLGGILTSDPAAVSWSSGKVDVVARGTDNAIWIRSWTASTGWNNWASLGGVATSGPDIASCTAGHLDVFVRGTDNGYWQLGYNAFNTTPWTGWRQEGNSWTSDPGVVCRAGTGIVDVFGRGSDLAMYTVWEPAS
jgi:hypothetical protein